MVVSDQNSHHINRTNQNCRHKMNLTKIKMMINCKKMKKPTIFKLANSRAYYMSRRAGKTAKKMNFNFKILNFKIKKNQCNLDSLRYRQKVP